MHIRMTQEDEPPSTLWGLDPIFSAFARLYIKDLLQIRESCQVPGNLVYLFFERHSKSLINIWNFASITMIRNGVVWIQFLACMSDS